MTSRDRDAQLGRTRGATVSEIIAKLASEPRGSSVPVTIHLRSGRDVRGVIRRVDRNDAGTMNLLVQPAGDGNELRDELTYLALAEIEAMTVHAASEWLDILSFGALDRLPAEIPSPLALRRRAGEIEERLAALTSTSMRIEAEFPSAPNDEAERYALAQTLDETERALENLVDRHGRAALANAVSVVEIAAGERPEVRREGARLIVVLNLQDGPRGRERGEALISAIKAVL